MTVLSQSVYPFADMLFFLSIQITLFNNFLELCNLSYDSFVLRVNPIISNLVNYLWIQESLCIDTDITHESQVEKPRGNDNYLFCFRYDIDERTTTRYGKLLGNEKSSGCSSIEHALSWSYSLDHSDTVKRISFSAISATCYPSIHFATVILCQKWYTFGYSCTLVCHYYFDYLFWAILRFI